MSFQPALFNARSAGPPLPLDSMAISPWREMGAYEALWTEDRAWFRSIAAKFAERPGALPSHFFGASPDQPALFAEKTHRLLTKAGVERYGIRLYGTGEYPAKLRDAEHPVELFYYQGFWDLIETRCVAIVGSRNPSEEGRKRAAKLARRLGKDGFTVVSGLAAGIDTVAHRTAIEEGNPTIAVIGTPLSSCYPRENRDLQRTIASDHLLISQVPVCRYSRQGPSINRGFFPERNVTMSALTEATIIVEAGNTSGTLTQARAAIKQGRKLFILESCFNDPSLTWPHTYASKGAIRVKDYDEILEHLNP